MGLRYSVPTKPTIKAQPLHVFLRTTISDYLGRNHRKLIPKGSTERTLHPTKRVLGEFGAAELLKSQPARRG